MDVTFDRLYYGEGEKIGGVDESGVSDIAGPLIAACVILPKIDLQKDDLKIFNVADSKDIPGKYLSQHAEVIWQTALAIGIGEVTPGEVDYLGRSCASRLAMLRAVMACKSVSRSKPMRPDFLIVDGDYAVHLDIRQLVTRDADRKSLCCAAASVVAKVYRDDIMVNLHRRFPFYDWASNKGHPCESQFRGMDKHGIQIGIHRIRSWPIIPNQTGRDEPEVAARWSKRRGRWAQLTEAKLGAETGEGLWTSKPPLWKPSESSKSSPLKGATTIKSSSAASAP